MQAMENGKAFPRGLMGDRSRSLSAYGNGNMLNPEQSPQGKIVIHHFTCRSLSIGSWRRVGQNAMDLVIFYSPEKACITYYINNDSAGYKIEYPFAYIKSIEIEGLDSPVTPHGAQKQGQLVITLTQPPNFFMDSSGSASGSGGFYQCGDFTEDQQASRVLTHQLGGHPKILQSQLAKLMTLDAFANRHLHSQSHLQQFYDNTTFSVSAPVSPQIVRPASSNDVDTSAGYPQDPAPGHNFHQKHRRTRSRSVPLAIDFSQIQQNMPSFSFQDAQDHLYAPAPQHPHALVSSGLSNPLRIDTSSSGFLEYRPGSAYPLSAATTTSPSDYSSPSMINSSLQHDMNNNAGYGTSYSLPFLSPMVDPTTNAIGTSVSPISIRHGDPVIASTSPPLSHLFRSTSSEIFPEAYDQQNPLSDDGVGLNELYSKQSLGLSGHSPSVDDQEDVDMQQMMQFSLAQGVTPAVNGM
ncbi:hypothetical protein C7212DRAFT_350439 [Tuber magnatum]|uniref:TRF2/HOY1 PH-like domain-containing protein n=1 Tax=Tuber magnatum TaxID=42249 RepID=A0A317SZ38_9PEZI|nr:hypothetical protein C7212DRAFT_350439 [Tuber magnatum]